MHENSVASFFAIAYPGLSLMAFFVLEGLVSRAECIELLESLRYHIDIFEEIEVITQWEATGEFKCNTQTIHGPCDYSKADNYIALLQAPHRCICALYSSTSQYHTAV